MIRVDVFNHPRLSWNIGHRIYKRQQYGIVQWISIYLKLRTPLRKRFAEPKKLMFLKSMLKLVEDFVWVLLSYYYIVSTELIIRMV